MGPHERLGTAYLKTRPNPGSPRREPADAIQIFAKNPVWVTAVHDRLGLCMSLEL